MRLLSLAGTALIGLSLTGCSPTTVDLESKHDPSATPNPQVDAPLANLEHLGSYATSARGLAFYGEQDMVHMGMRHTTCAITTTGHMGRDVDIPDHDDDTVHDSHNGHGHGHGHGHGNGNGNHDDDDNDDGGSNNGGGNGGGNGNGNSNHSQDPSNTNTQVLVSTVDSLYLLHPYGESVPYVPNLFDMDVQNGLEDPDADLLRRGIYRIPAVGVIDARFAGDRIAAWVEDQGQCRVDFVAVDEAAISVELDAALCASDGDFTADPESGVAYVASPAGVVAVHPSGEVTQLHDGATRIAWDAIAEVLYLASGDRVTTLGVNGQERWSTELQGQVRDLDSRGGSVAVMLELESGSGELLMIDAWTAIGVMRMPTPEPAREVHVSSSGRQIALMTDEEVHFFRVP